MQYSSHELSGEAVAGRAEAARERCSGVPDLLFEDARQARLGLLAPYLETLGVGAALPLPRVTVLVTYRCNLACAYCKTVTRDDHNARAGGPRDSTLSEQAFGDLLRTLGHTPIEHIHFTGGEATLAPHLVAMVHAARERRVRWLSLTSNGTAAPERYVELVGAGLCETRLSVDARDAAMGAKLTGRPSAWPRTIAALRALVAARDAGARVRVVANVVVGRDNRADLVGIVRFLLALRPDDIKLITEVSMRETLGDFAARRTIERELAGILAAAPASAFPLLRKKLATVFAPDAIGLEPTAARRQGGSWRCYVPLTERTCDSRGYYPCTVYQREGGAAIGCICETAAEQRAKTAAWIASSDCRRDPICRAFCLHCTRTFNDEANALRGQP